MLSRLLQHCCDLGDLGYPKIGYHTWKHIAVKKVILFFLEILKLIRINFNSYFNIPARGLQILNLYHILLH